MSNYTTIREIVSRFSGQDNVFTVPKLFVELTGDFTTAILLNQIVFLSDKSKRKDGYFYKSYKEWEEEICMTERQVRYSADKLKKMGLIETKLKKANGAPTLHYKLDYDKLVEWILTKCQIPSLQNVSIDSDKVSDSLTETTTENTTEINYIYSLFEHWNSKEIIVHRKINQQMKSHINARLQEYSFEELKKAIDNYHEILTSDKYYWTHRWTLQDFMKPMNVVRFMDESKPFDVYLDKGKRQKQSVAVDTQFENLF